MLVAHDPVAPELLAQLLEQPVASVERWCEELRAEYASRQRGFEFARVAGGYRYQTHPDQTPYVERFVLHDQKARLSGAALETLAIVAYKQPISRAQVASIRGVDPDGVIRTLQARGLHRRGRARQRTRPGDPVRNDAAVPREARARLARRPAADRRVHPRRRRRRGARTRPARQPGRPRRRRRHRRPGAPEMASLEERMPEPPLWEQWAEQRAQLPQGERLQKVLASTGWGSRRACEELIAAGRVTVNGEVAELGRRVQPEVDEIEVDGAPVGVKPGLVYYLLNKPRGHGHHRQGHARAADRGRARAVRAACVPRRPARRRHRGAAAAHQRRRAGPPHQPTPATASRRSTSPTCAAGCRRRALRRLRDGVELEDGMTAAGPGVATVARACCGSRSTRAATARCGGCARPSGIPVLRLVRTRIGPISDRSLRPGDWRELSTGERKALTEAVAEQARRYDQRP